MSAKTTGSIYQLTVGFSHPTLFPGIPEDPTPQPVTARTLRGAKRKATIAVGVQHVRGEWRKTRSGSWQRQSARGPLNLTAQTAGETEAGS